VGEKVRQVFAGVCFSIVAICLIWMYQSLSAGESLVLPLIVAMAAALIGGYLWNRAKDEARH
jgi:hypothetical protein